MNPSVNSNSITAIMWTTIVVFLSYICAFLSSAFIIIPFYGYIGFIIIIAGWFLAWPFLLAATLMAISFRKKIDQNLAIWCFPVPLFALVSWTLSEYLIEYQNRNLSLLEYLHIKNVQERMFLVVLVSSMCALFFYKIYPSKAFMKLRSRSF